MGEPVLKTKPGLANAPADNGAAGLKIYHSQIEDVDQYESATFRMRFFAALIDAVIFSMIQKVVAGFLLKGLFVYITARSRGLGGLASLTESTLVIFYYYAWPISEFGQTLGKKFMNLRVVNTASHHDLSIMQAFGRETIGKTLSAIPLGFGFFMVLFDKKKLALHDKLMKTKVIKY